MRGKTKVSICIPCYQQAMDVRRLLDSILQQDYTDFEVILTDDSGDDEVERVAADYRDRIVERKRPFFIKEIRFVWGMSGTGMPLCKRQGESI